MLQVVRFWRAVNVFGTTRGAARTLCSWIVDCAGMSLAGDVAIVTGGGDGIGGATARRLAEEGASVLIVEVSELGEQNAAAIRAAGGVAEAVVLDVSKSEDVKAMVQTAVEKFGKVTILVNNACVQSRWPDWWRPHVECD
jgi:NAD(P)-dependent dehydrogenase (short-subunit alcohol dehydrogenase family)